MFYGHYCGAWIIKVLEPKIPLWVLMVAVQFIDFIFCLFILFDIEEVRITRGFTKSNDLELIYIPYTHSLIAVIGWSILYGVWYKISRYDGGNRAAFLVGLAVLSHWFEDLLVHKEDLPLTFYDTQTNELISAPENCKLLVIIMLILYVIMAILAHRLDKVRVTRHNNRISDKLKLLNE
ncbi:1927_t:CDS:2 [Rhizophagus irregularis]|nr:1927_t:CDS:2 [Rhizophagus irregularis]